MNWSDFDHSRVEARGEPVPMRCCLSLAGWAQQELGRCSISPEQGLDLSALQRPSGSQVGWWGPIFLLLKAMRNCVLVGAGLSHLPKSEWNHDGTEPSALGWGCHFTIALEGTGSTSFNAGKWQSAPRDPSQLPLPQQCPGTTDCVAALDEFWHRNPRSGWKPQKQRQGAVSTSLFCPPVVRRITRLSVCATTVTTTSRLM